MTDEPESNRLGRRIRALVRWARTRLPPGLRSLAGVLFVLGGLVGFLPVVGFWMIPLGLALIWLDIAALANYLRRRVKDRDGEH